MKVIHSFLVVALVSLAACGGGGGTTTTDASGNTIRTTNYPNWAVSNTSSARAIAQGEISNRTVAELNNLGLSLRSSATRFIASDFLAGLTGTVERYRTTCFGRTCTVNLPTGSIPVSLDDPVPGGSEDQRLFSRNGIDILQSRLRLENSPTTGLHQNTVVVGGILDYSSFSVEVGWLYQGTQLTDIVAISSSAGFSPSTNPSSSISTATWTGAMVGIDYSTGTLNRLNVLHGDANIVVRGLDTTPTVDVNFSRVRNLNTGASHTLFGWSNIPLSNGNFRRDTGISKIEGTFYGSEHQEVGGHFEQGRIIGAFGGKRP